MDPSSDASRIRRQRSSSFGSSEADLLLGDWQPVVKSKKKLHYDLPHVNTICAVVITLTAVIPCYAYYAVHFTTDYDRNFDHSISKGVQIVAQIFGWLSATLYVGSRLPQILKNWRKKSTEGLSWAMFAVAVLGNVFFTLVSEVLLLQERKRLSHAPLPFSLFFSDPQSVSFFSSTWHGLQVLSEHSPLILQ